MEEQFTFQATGDKVMDKFLGRFGKMKPMHKTIVETNPELVTMNSDKSMIDPLAKINADGFSAWLKENENQKANAKEGITSADGSNKTGLFTGRENRLENKMDRISDRIDKAADSGNTEKVEKLTEKLGSTGDKLGEGGGEGPGAGAYAQAAMGAYNAVGNFKGDQFDTSAEGPGVGKAGGAIASGAASGASAGAAFGPWGMAAGAVVGGLASTFGHSKAMKEWRENQVTHNRKLNALETAKLDDSYAMAKGMNSMQNIKALRQKQLGILS